DKSCFLSEHENRLLCTLCSCAGEVVSIQTLYQKTFIEIDPFEDCDQQYDLNLLLMALSKKLNYRGQMLIPIHVIPSFGYRVPLPHRKSQSTHKPILQKAFPPTQNESDTVSCINLVKLCQQHKKTSSNFGIFTNTFCTIYKDNLEEFQIFQSINKKYKFSAIVSYTVIVLI
ncbi:hypothetical protein QTN99_20620, partial [Photobacterium damselae]